MHLVRDRYLVTGLAALIALVSIVAVVYAASPHFHTTNGAPHGLLTSPGEAFTHSPYVTNVTVEFRHYFDQDNWNQQCAKSDPILATCPANYGTAPCQKRYVGGAYGYLTRHWLRLLGCPGSLHA